MPKKSQRVAKKSAAKALPQEFATPAAQGLPPVRTEQDVHSFLSLLDHYFEAGALSEESYFEVKGEALKKLAHLKKQKAFGASTAAIAQQAGAKKQELQEQPAHKKKLYDAAEKAMEAAVRAAGTKLLGIRPGAQPAFEEAENLQQFSQQPQQGQMQQPVQASGLDGASVTQLKKARGDAEAMLEFIEESFSEGGLSEENYRSTRASKMRELSRIKSLLQQRLGEYDGDDAVDSDESDEQDSDEEGDAEGEEEPGEYGLNVFGSRKTRALAPKAKARKKRGNEFDDGLSEAAEKTRAKYEAAQEEIPESFPSFSKLMGSAAPEIAEENGEAEESGEIGELEELEESRGPRLLKGEHSHLEMELELLGALGLKKNKHALQELENTVVPGEGERYSFYGAKTAKAKAGNPGDDLAGTFTPESIAEDEKKQREKDSAGQPQDAAGAFLSKLKSFIPAGPSGNAQGARGGQAQNGGQSQQGFAQSQQGSPSEEAAVATDFSASTMKILMELEKLKAKTETLGEMRNALDERLGHIQESLGELRSMTFARESGQKELEAKVEKYLDLVENLEPQKFLKEFDKRDKELAAQDMRLEKLEAASADLARVANSTKSLLESMGSLKNLSSLNKEVSEKLSKMDSTVNRSQKTADDVDRAFVEVGNKLEEFSIYAGKQEVLGQTVQDLVEMLETTNKKFDAYVGKDDLDKYGKQLENVNLSISELKATKLLQEDGRDLPPRTRELLKQKESVEFLLASIEEDFDAREMTAQDYEIAKRANLQKLSQVEKALREEYDQITDVRKQEEFKATEIAKNVCVEPGVMKAREGFEHEEAAKPEPAKALLKNTAKKGFFEKAFSAIPSPDSAKATGKRVEEEKTAQESPAPVAQALAMPLHSQSLSDSLMHALGAKHPAQYPPAAGGKNWREKRSALRVQQQASANQGIPPQALVAEKRAQELVENASAENPETASLPKTQPARLQPGVPMRAKSRAGGEKPVFDLKKLLEIRLKMQDEAGAGKNAAGKKPASIPLAMPRKAPVPKTAQKMRQAPAAKKPEPSKAQLRPKLKQAAK